MPLRVRFFDAEGTVVKTMFTEQVDQQSDRTYVRRMSIVDGERASTTMVIESIDFDADVSNTEFTRENLSR